jgi:hypothetical protein
MHTKLNSLLLLTLAPLAASLQEVDDDAQDLRRVFEVVALLEENLKEVSAEKQLEVLQAARGAPHDEVAAGVKPYAIADDPAVRMDAIDVLRWMKVPGATEALEELFKRRPYPKNDDWIEAVVKGIGQHAAKRSIEVLGQPPRAFRNEKAVRAQILALGRIRHRLAIQALIDLFPRFGRHRDKYVPEFRLSLVALTALDKGQDPGDWIAWWEGEKLSFRVPEALSLPSAQLKRWMRYWNITEDRREREDE